MQHIIKNSECLSTSLPSSNTSKVEKRRRRSTLSSDEISSSESFELQDLVRQYESQPEILKLILASKVEEDKRRAEEAKLRIKELDLYAREKPSPINTLSCSSSHHCHYHSNNSSTSCSSSNNIPLKRRMSNSSSLSATSSLSSVCSSVINNDNAGEESTTTIIMNDHQRRRNSAAFAMVAMGTQQSPPPTSPQQQQQHVQYPSSTSSFSPPSSPSNSYPSPDSMYNNNNSNDNNNNSKEAIEEERPRKRREMQAITKIVETRDFPYQDDYFWKNNGNTTQKKTGCKSIYYKCSNSNKGCPVNKTVTARPNGEYLIKYRGNHLSECGRVERVRDI
ncbi:hypothetical protein INT45_010998 [Circinella minor]|uniref:WRKY domain-containing protein n=1 Tax=Circinella minor TaxID=1195481 RepID=A0A8H7SFK3_9FUNG|nr:hypothetical protein INT45_010998 [Circinella minor]